MKNEKHPFLSSTNTRAIYQKLYGNDEQIQNKQEERFRALITSFYSRFPSEMPSLYSTPGRIEIGGNHTDHNHGRVIAASINLDSIAAAARNNDNTTIIYSAGYKDPFVVDLSQLNPVKNENGTTHALIRGIAARLKESGQSIGGFNAYISSDVLPGSGLSSSASIEVLIGTILNDLYNENKVSPLEIAKAGQYAENNYFGKPCGLMDQTACAEGGIISIDFKSPENPVIEKIEYDFSTHNYHIIVVDTGGSHADLTQDYASIPGEMKKIASIVGADVCRDTTGDIVLSHIADLRKNAGDRAILRAFHFFAENRRVKKQLDALKKDDLPGFLQLVTDSGNSSWKWLQNIYAPHHPGEQGITLALALTEQFIEQSGHGACRVHGGGFAGTMLAFLPDDVVQHYSSLMENVFGNYAVKILTIRQTGTTRIWP